MVATARQRQANRERARLARAGSIGNQRRTKTATLDSRADIESLKISRAKARHRRDVSRYVTDVLTGKILVGVPVRQAVERYVADLERFELDEDRAARVINFIETYCRHTAGEFEGDAFRLEPWQKFICWAVFGFVSNGFRRFRYVFVSVARKNGKSAFAAALVLALQLADTPLEPRAQLFGAATKIEQSNIVFDEVGAMIRANPELDALFVRLHKSIKCPGLDSAYRVVSADKPYDGLGPHLVVLDELHAFRETHRKFFDTMRTGSGSKRQPILCCITTSGDDDSDIYNEETNYIRKVLDGELVDDRMFAYLAELDKDDDPFDEAVWIKSNPNLDVSVKREYLRQQAHEAEHKPSLKPAFLRYHCNRSTSTTAHVINRATWNKGARALPSNLADYPCWLGLDLGRSYDWSALGWVWKLDDDEFAITARCWTCAEGKMPLNREPFIGFINAGLLEVHPGTSVNFAEIERHVGEAIETHEPEQLAFDSHGAKTLATRVCNEWQTPAFEFFQTYIAYNEPLKTFLKALDDGRIYHGGDELLEWQALNLIRKADPADRWMPDKRSPDRKVDALVAIIMAFRLAMFDEVERLTYYDDNEVELI